MRVKSVQREWEEFARTNPLWAILTDPARKQHWDPVEFFETGQADVERLLSQLDGLKLKVTFGRALDFGCGVGRVSRALGTRFESVVGLDISHEMIRLAREYNRDCPSCTFAVNASDRINLPSDTYDLVYCRLVLQHLPPALATRYIKELVRVVAPSGLLVFQLPTAAPGYDAEVTGWKRYLPFLVVRGYRVLRSRFRRPFPCIAMYGSSVAAVAETIATAGGQLLHVLPDKSHGDGWPGFQYVVTK